MISTNDVKPGMALQLGDGLFQIVEYQHVKPGKGKAFVRMKLKNVEIELIGTWLWIHGDTKPVKEQLKAHNCKWHSKRKCWYWHTCFL